MRRKLLGSAIVVSLVLSSSIGFSGCSAMKTAVTKRNLEIQTKMSDTVFLEPVAPEERIVYFDLRDTSSKHLDVVKKIRANLEKRGYKITDNPKKATYMLQGNILTVTKTNRREAEALSKSAYGSAIAGGIAAGATANALGANGGQTTAYALAGAGLGFIGDSLVEDTVYVMVTDLQIRERPLEGEVITQTQQANLKQGLATNTQQNIQGGKVKWKTYRTRVVSTAEQMNLDFEDAKKALENELASAIAGVF